MSGARRALERIAVASVSWPPASRVLGWLSDLPLPRPLRGPLIHAYARAYGVDLSEAALAYVGTGLTVAELEERFEKDLERAVTGAGPHLRDAAITAGARDLRSFGSQGEQRTAVLALVLAEAGVLDDQRGEPPLLLLDDVFSELDRARSDALVGRLPKGGQTVVTATERPEALPVDLVVEVSPGEARAAA